MIFLSSTKLSGIGRGQIMVRHPTPHNKYGRAAKGGPVDKEKKKYFVAIFAFGSAFIYWVLISLVWQKPEIMSELGFEPFVQYVMYEFDPKGYENLVQQAGNAFASHFFHIHAASILIFLCISVLCIPCLLFIFRNESYKTVYDTWLIDIQKNADLHKSHKNLDIIFWSSIAITCFAFWAFFDLPSSMGHNRRLFHANDQGMTEYAFLWAGLIIFYVLMTFMIFMLAKFHYGPKLKPWLGKWGTRQV